MVHAPLHWSMQHMELKLTHVLLHACGRRLNYRLSMACHETIQEKCADACVSKSVEQPCGGTVLRCLTEKLEEITDAECKKEVFYFVKMEARSRLCSLCPCTPAAPAVLAASEFSSFPELLRAVLANMDVRRCRCQERGLNATSAAQLL